MATDLDGAVLAWRLIRLADDLRAWSQRVTSTLVEHGHDPRCPRPYLDLAKSTVDHHAQEIQQWAKDIHRTNGGAR